MNDRLRIKAEDALRNLRDRRDNDDSTNSFNTNKGRDYEALKDYIEYLEKNQK